MSKRPSKHGKKPTRPRRDPADNALRLLNDDSANLRRRFMMSKGCLKQKPPEHRKEAIKVLRLVADSPKIGDKGRDLATRLLMKHDAPRRTKPMQLPRSWKGLIGGLAGKKVRWVGDETFLRLPKAERFPDYSEPRDE
jgi:hypothetical protein